MLLEICIGKCCISVARNLGDVLCVTDDLNAEVGKSSYNAIDEIWPYGRLPPKMTVSNKMLLALGC